MFRFEVTEIPFYKGNLIVCVSNELEKINKEFDIHRSGEIFAHSYQFDYQSKQAFMVLLNPNWEYDNITHGIIAHECLHILSFVYENRGVRKSKNNDEHEAYFLGWIVTEVYKALDKFKVMKQIKVA